MSEDKKYTINIPDEESNAEESTAQNTDSENINDSDSVKKPISTEDLLNHEIFSSQEDEKIQLDFKKPETYRRANTTSEFTEPLEDDLFELDFTKPDMPSEDDDSVPTPLEVAASALFEITFKDDDVEAEEEVISGNMQDNVYDAQEFADIPRRTRKPKKKKTKRKASIIPGIIMTVVILVVSAVLVFLAMAGIKDFLGIWKPDKKITVTIEQGSQPAQIAKLLKNSGVIEYDFLFLLAVKMEDADQKFQYGTYELNSNMSYSQIIKGLQKIQDMRVSKDVTFKEGWSVIQIAEELEKNNICTAKEFLTKIDEKEFIDSLYSKHELKFAQYLNKEREPKRLYQMEGFYFPDKYKFYEGSTPEEAALIILKNFNRKFTSEMYEQMAANKTGLNLEEVVALASVVHQEAAHKSDMKLISSVFENRLNDKKNSSKTNRMLQSDPTKKYVEEIIAPLIEGDDNTKAAELKKYNDVYNTYVCKGLPVGAICNPSLEAIKAVLTPTDSNYYYFCANLKTGVTYYATTLSEHNSNLRKAGLR